MGIAFITAKAEKFKQQRDAAFEDQLQSEGLLSRLPDVKTTSYRCKLIGDTFPEIGTPVLLYKGGDFINVFSLNNHIGVCMPADTDDLLRIMVLASTDVLAAIVVEIRLMTNTFLVQLQLPTS